MVWPLWLVVAAITVGLPAAALRNTRRMKPSPPLGSPGPWAGPVERWLFEQYRLGVLDRARITSAVFGKGRVPADLRLRKPARELAAEVLAGKVRLPRPQRMLGWIYTATGILGLTSGLVGRFVAPGLRRAFEMDIVQGAAITFLGACFALFWIPQDLRRKAQNALTNGPEPLDPGSGLLRR
jgi:hypothetical protein